MNSQARAALGGSRLDTPLFVGATVLGLGAGAVVALAMSGSARPPPALAFFAGALAFAVLTGAAALVIFVVLVPLRASRALEQLTALPFAFDRDAYVDLLGEEHGWTVLELVAHFTASVPEAAVQAILASQSASAFANGRWIDDQTLRFSSPSLETSFSGSGAATAQSYRSNEAVHRWLTHRAIPLLLTLHARAPIAKVDCRR